MNSLLTTHLDSVCYVRHYCSIILHYCSQIRKETDIYKEKRLIQLTSLEVQVQDWIVLLVWLLMSAFESNGRIMCWRKGSDLKPGTEKLLCIMWTFVTTLWEELPSEGMLLVT